MQKQDLHVNGLNHCNSPKPSLIKCKYYFSQAKVRHYKHIFKDTPLNKQCDNNIINKTTIMMHIAVMNNDNFVVIHRITVSQYTMKCETTTKIYSVRKLNT